MAHGRSPLRYGTATRPANEAETQGNPVNVLVDTIAKEGRIAQKTLKNPENGYLEARA